MTDRHKCKNPVQLRISDDLRQRVMEAARTAKRSMNKEIAFRLEESLRTAPPTRASAAEPAPTPVAWRFRFDNEGFTHPALRKMQNEWIDVETSGLPTAEDLELAPCEFAYRADSLAAARTGIDTAELAARIAEWIGAEREQRP